MKIKYGVNLWAGIISTVSGLILLAMIPSQIGSEYSSNYGITSKTVPGAAAVIFILCGLALVVQSLVFKKDTQRELDLAKEGKAAAYMAVFVVYVLLFDKSFLLASAVLGVMTLVFTKSRNKWYYLITLVTVVCLYLLFTQVLHVRLK